MINKPTPPKQISALEGKDAIHSHVPQALFEKNEGSKTISNESKPNVNVPGALFEQGKSVSKSTDKARDAGYTPQPLFTPTQHKSLQTDQSNQSAVSPVNNAILNGAISPLFKKGEVTPHKSISVSILPAALLPESASPARGIHIPLTTDTLTPFGSLSSDQVQWVRKILSELDFLETKSVMDYGSNCRTQSSIASDQFLAIAREGNNELPNILSIIRQAVASVEADDILLRKHNPSAYLSEIFFGQPSEKEDVLQAALSIVEAQTPRVQQAIPNIIGLVEKLDALKLQVRKNHAYLVSYQVAGKIALEHAKNVTIKAMKERKDGNVFSQHDIELVNFNIQILEKSVDKITDNIIMALEDEPRIVALKTTYVQWSQTARDTVLDLVADWKRYCATALIMRKSKQDGELGKAAGEILAARDKLIHLLDIK